MINLPNINQSAMNNIGTFKPKEVPAVPGTI